MAVGFLPGSGRLAAVMEERLWIWDAIGPDSRPRAITPPRSTSRAAFATAEGGAAAAASGFDGRIRVFDASGREVLVLSPFEGPEAAEGVATRGPAISADGSTVAAGTSSGALWAWRLAEAGGSWKAGEPVRRETLGDVKEVAVSAEGGTVAAASGNRVHLVPTAPGQADRAVALTGATAPMAFSPDGRWLVATGERGGSGAWGGTVLWRLDPRALPLIWPLRNPEADRPGGVAAPPVTSALAFSPDGRALVLADTSGEVRAWDLPSGERRATIPAGAGKVGQIAAAPEGSLLLQITALPDGIARAWDLRVNAQGIENVAAPLPAVEGARWDAGAVLPGDRGIVLTCSEDLHKVHVVDPVSGRKKADLEWPRDSQTGAFLPRSFTTIAATADGHYAAGGSAQELSGPACVWDLEKGTLLFTYRDEKYGVKVVAFPPEGNAVLAGMTDGSARLLSLEPEPRVLKAYDTGDGSEVTALAIHPKDGRIVAVGSRFGRVAVFGPGDGPPREFLARGARISPVTALAFTPDGTHLAASRENEKAPWLWTTDDPARPIRLVGHTERVASLLAWPGSRVLFERRGRRDHPGLVGPGRLGPGDAHDPGRLDRVGRLHPGRALRRLARRLEAGGVADAGVPGSPPGGPVLQRLPRLRAGPTHPQGGPAEPQGADDRPTPRAQGHLDRPRVLDPGEARGRPEGLAEGRGRRDRPADRLEDRARRRPHADPAGRPGRLGRGRVEGAGNDHRPVPGGEPDRGPRRQ